jgi:hypothetical protein
MIKELETLNIYCDEDFGTSDDDFGLDDDEFSDDEESSDDNDDLGIVD